MIKANELRIGNYTHLELANDNHALCVMGAKEIMAVELGSFKFNPIPLTEEWLVRFGFDFINEGGMFCNIHHSISETRKELDYWIFMPFCTNDEDCYIKIKYVHQLQNLVHALTEEELTIKEQ